MKPISFRAQSNLRSRIAAFEREFFELEKFYDSNLARIRAGEWGALTAASSAIDNIRVGIKGALLAVTKDIARPGVSEDTVYLELLRGLSGTVANSAFEKSGFNLVEVLTALEHPSGKRWYGSQLHPKAVVERQCVLRTWFPDIAKVLRGFEPTAGLIQKGVRAGARPGRVKLTVVPK